ncbi:MAG TPA: ATP-binding cassette domain-containing protein, partial [Kiloniellales bacterium]|nr:ATP-binding cassette domain-containing protein [Kiloniellales bacterium]
MTETLLEARSVRRTFGGGRSLFGTRQPAVEAVRHVDLDLERGETLGLVGESGCGKSTFARMVAGLDTPSAGRIRLDGEDVSALARHDMRALARRIQYVFQDAQSALNPRKTIRRILEAPMIHLLHLGRDERARRLESLMEAVNLEPEHLERYPHEFSGGQAQRIGIARALAAE